MCTFNVLHFDHYLCHSAMWKQYISLPAYIWWVNTVSMTELSARNRLHMLIGAFSVAVYVCLPASACM